MFTYQVSIGRNTIGGEPLRKEDWVRFVNGVTDAMGTLMDSGPGRPETHFGTGVWDGVSEDSALITVRRDSAADEYALQNVRKWLSIDARVYGQAAIGLMVGQSDLIYPSRYGY